MAKCIRCGSGFLSHKRVQLKDADICFKCFKELGFEKRDLLTAPVYKYDDIKFGRSVYYATKSQANDSSHVIIAPGLSITNYGQERDLVCTEQEREIYNFIVSAFPGEPLRLIRVSSEYVTIRRLDWDIVRLKYTTRAKWLMFPTAEIKQVKHRITDTDEVNDYIDVIRDSIETAKKYSEK